MADLIKLGNELINDIPDLKPTFFSISAVMGELTFASRMHNNYTQKQLADLAGVGVKTIYRIEGGSGGITDKTYQKVFNVLEITPEDIAEAFDKKKFIKQKTRELQQV